MPKEQAETWKEDPRQRRSRRRLTEALLSLVAERHYRDISVVDICQRAMVHRTTFYAHFEDKDALFRYVLEEELREAAKTRPQISLEHGLRHSLRQQLAVALHFCATHRNTYITGLDGKSSAQLQAIEDRIAQRIRELLLESYPDESPVMVELTGRFYAGSLMSVARWWISESIPLTEEELLELMCRLLPDHWETE